MTINLKKPTIRELSYRQKILADKDTMEYNKKWGWTIDFNKTKWDSWYNKWISNNNRDYFYAYIVDVSTESNVGEVAYHYDKETNTVMLSIIIEANKRGKGYGKTGLKKLVEEAFKNGFNEVRDTIAVDNIIAQKAFEKFGFICVEETPEYCDYRLTKEVFENQ